MMMMMMQVLPVLCPLPAWLCLTTVRCFWSWKVWPSRRRRGWNLQWWRTEAASPSWLTNRSGNSDTSERRHRMNLFPILTLCLLSTFPTVLSGGGQRGVQPELQPLAQHPEVPDAGGWRGLRVPLCGRRDSFARRQVQAGSFIFFISSSSSTEATCTHAYRSVISHKIYKLKFQGVYSSMWVSWSPTLDNK